MTVFLKPTGQLRLLRRRLKPGGMVIERDELQAEMSDQSGGEREWVRVPIVEADKNGDPWPEAKG